MPDLCVAPIWGLALNRGHYAPRLKRVAVRLSTKLVLAGFARRGKIHAHEARGGVPIRVGDGYGLRRPDFSAMKGEL